MTLEPLLAAPFVIRLHLAFALVALLFGPVALMRRRRDRLHRITGYLGAAGMAGLALTAFFIASDFAVIGPFGPIHLLAPYALFSLGMAIARARQRDFVAHAAWMRGLWFSAIGVTGLLTLLPGRVLNRVLFGEPSAAGFGLIALGALGLAGLWLRHRPRRTPARST